MFERVIPGQSHKSLQECLEIVNKVLQENPENTFALSCLNFLTKKGFLSKKQIDCLQKMDEWEPSTWQFYDRHEGGFSNEQYEDQDYDNDILQGEWGW